MINASEQYLKYLLEEPDYEKFSDTMTRDFTVDTKITSEDGDYSSTDDKETFLSDVKVMHFENIVKNEDGSYIIKDNKFEYTPDGINQLVWNVQSTQLRKGDGVLEESKAWYTMVSQMTVNFALENNKTKISYMKQEYTKS